MAAKAESFNNGSGIPYLPKWCILIYRSGVLLIANFGALLITDYIGYQSNFIHKDADEALEAVIDF